MLFSSRARRRTASGARPRRQEEPSSTSRRLQQRNRIIATEVTFDPQEREAVEQASVRCAQEYLRRRAQGRETGRLLPLEWDGFFLSHYRVVAGMVKRYMPTDSWEDAAQDVWLVITSALPDFQWRENLHGFAGWLATITHNATVDFIRRRARPAAGHLDPVLAQEKEPADPGPGPALAVELQAQRDAVNAVLEQLRPRIGEDNYRIVRLRYWEGCPLADIARSLGLTPNEVSCRLRRVLQQLRARLLPCGHDQ
jgi:RNA polymerase sigma factor (sigma-70 family)